MMNTSESIYLVEQALNHLQSPGEVECAIWRLVDAVGLLSAQFPHAIGIADATGRGYRIQLDRRRTP